MAIRTKDAVSGYIASDPQLSTTKKGDDRFYAQFGQKDFRLEEDGTWTKTGTEYHHLVIFGKAATHAYKKFKRGDDFIAEGYKRDVQYVKDGVNIEDEEFVARRIGHDSARTRYEVERTPRRAAEHEPVTRESTAFGQAPSTREPADHAIGM